MVNLNISRRSLNKAICAGGLLLSVGLPACAVAKSKVHQEALLHISSEGELMIYSGVANLGHHGGEDAISPVCSLLGVRKYRLMSGRSPKHLPSILGQHQTDLCFTNATTNLKAAHLLSSFLAVGVRTGKFIDSGVSENTKALAMSLDPKGMTIAVKA